MNQDFEKYAPAIISNPQPMVQDKRLLMDKDGSISIFYAPFEHVNPEARVALVGITPGPTQMMNSVVETRASLARGESKDMAMIKAKETASFSGEPMRTNLINQLNHWGFNEWLGINDCSALFSRQKHLLHSTSLLRYPVFVRGKGYAGNPNMIGTPILRRYIVDYFVEEINELPDAVFLPLGPKVTAVISQLVREGVIDAGRVINGLLHPSGNNTYRLNWLLGDRDSEVPYRTNPVTFDEGRQSFREKHLN